MSIPRSRHVISLILDACRRYARHRLVIAAAMPIATYFFEIAMKIGRDEWVIHCRHTVILAGCTPNNG